MPYKIDDFHCNNEDCECYSVVKEIMYSANENIECGSCSIPMTKLIGAVSGKVINPAVTPGKSRKEMAGNAVEAYSNALKKLKNKK